MKKKSSDSLKKKYTAIKNNQTIEYRSFETYLIGKFISEGTKVNYPIEIKMAKKMGEISRLQEFWDSIESTQVTSLRYFIKAENWAIIKYQFEEFMKGKWQEFQDERRKNLDLPQKHVILQEQKVGEDVSIPKKILSLKDFLLYG